MNTIVATRIGTATHIANRAQTASSVRRALENNLFHSSIYISYIWRSKPVVDDFDFAVSFDDSSRPAGERMVLGIKGIEVAFRWIQPDSFVMGGADDEADGDEKPVHKVIITKGFWLAETPTTQRLWKSGMGLNPSKFKGDDLPVEMVSWHECNDFIGRLNSSLRSSSNSTKLGR